MKRHRAAGNSMRPVARVGIAVAVFLVIAGVVLWIDSGLRQYAGWLLALIPLVGAALAAAAEREDRGVWGEVGRSLTVAGLLAFAVWLVNDLRQPVEERNALQVTLGLQQEMPGVDLHGEDLSGFDLARKNMEGADLEGADLDHTTLVETNLTNANLTNADLSDANLEHSVLVGANLSHADLEDVEATKAQLRGARLMEADLEGAELSGADLRGACLAKASLIDASLPDARLKEAALTGADLQGARFWFDLRQAYLGYVGMDGAQHADNAHWPPNFAKRAEELTAPANTDSPAVATLPHGNVGSAHVVWVFDGDTVWLKTKRRRHRRMRARMIGIDAPAAGRSGGDAATDLLRELLPRGAHVSYVHDERREDAYGRRLLYLFTPDGGLANQIIVERGLAVAHIDPPTLRGARNTRYAAKLKAAEAWARQHALGLWLRCPP